MDLINECEWEVITYSDGFQQIVFDNLEYWLLQGKGFVTFELCLN